MADRILRALDERAPNQQAGVHLGEDQACCCEMTWTWTCACGMRMRMQHGRAHVACAMWHVECGMGMGVYRALLSPASSDWVRICMHVTCAMWHGHGHVPRC